MRCLGWAFLLAWVFCVFYSGSMDGLAGTIEQQTGGGPTELLLNVLPVGSAVATLIIAVAAEKRLGPPTSSRKIIVDLVMTQEWWASFRIPGKQQKAGREQPGRPSFYASLSPAISRRRRVWRRCGRTWPCGRR